jgi:hypothetical protein
MPKCTMTNGPVWFHVRTTTLVPTGVSAGEEEKSHVNRMIEVGRVGPEPTTDGL